MFRLCSCEKNGANSYFSCFPIERKMQNGFPRSCICGSLLLKTMSQKRCLYLTKSVFRFGLRLWIWIPFESRGAGIALLLVVLTEVVFCLKNCLNFSTLLKQTDFRCAISSKILASGRNNSVKCT